MGKPKKIYRGALGLIPKNASPSALNYLEQGWFAKRGKWNCFRKRCDDDLDASWLIGVSYSYTLPSIMNEYTNPYPANEPTATLFMGYFHQDWPEDYGTWHGVLDAYMSDYAGTESVELADYIDKVIANASGEEEVFQWADDHKLGYYCETPRELVEFLRKVIVRLRDTGTVNNDT